MNAQVKLVRTLNELSLMTGEKKFMTTLFNGPDGWYYDEIGDEIFHAKKMATYYMGVTPFSVYRIEFEDHFTKGVVTDHGFNIFLGGDE